MNKLCFVCSSAQTYPPKSQWIEEKHYQGSVNTVKEVFIDIDNPPTEKSGQKYLKSLFYCSIQCLEKQFDYEEAKAWAKGKCSVCQMDLVVINEQCLAPLHQQEMKYLPVNLKGNHD